VTVPVPYPLPATSGWQVADWIDQRYTSAPAGADGIALVTIPTLPDSERWQLTHMLCGCTSSTVTQMRLYLDDVANANLRDGSSSGNFDVADWPQGLWIPPGRGMVARWFGCSAGAVATLTLQATILRRVN
jgi:hypothetical protein